MNWLNRIRQSTVTPWSIRRHHGQRSQLRHAYASQRRLSTAWRVSNKSKRSNHMENNRSSFFTFALILGIIGTVGFFLLAAAVAGSGM